MKKRTGFLYCYAVVVMSLIAAPAFADNVPQKTMPAAPVLNKPVPGANVKVPAAGKFLPLSADRAPAHATPAKSVATGPAHFIALSPTNFRYAGTPTPVNTSLIAHVNHPTDMPKMEEASLKEISSVSAHTSKIHGMISHEQAQQILSIFDPAN